MDYQVHNIRTGSMTDVYFFHTLEEAKEVADSKVGEDAVWCDAEAWHCEDNLIPVGGYDFGEGDAVIIYEVAA